ncbi:MAG: hypothetical protein QNJ67_20650 [Kiloniellales bacterium]|nr:hypothetical protein [Kiloniellales bacterium]
MTRLIGLSVIVLLLALGGCRSAPVENVDSAPLNVPEGVSLERIKKSIMRAGFKRDWEMTEVGPGHLVAQVEVRDKHTAIVDIYFDRKTFSISYKDSRNLGYDGENIHANYNSWVQFLKEDIQKEMKLIALEASLDPRPRAETVRAEYPEERV